MIADHAEVAFLDFVGANDSFLDMLLEGWTVLCNRFVS